MGIFDNVRAAKAAFKTQQSKYAQMQAEKRKRELKKLQEQQKVYAEKANIAKQKAKIQALKTESRKNSVLGRITARAKENQQNQSSGFGNTSSFGNSPFTSGFGPNPYQQTTQKAGKANKKDVKEAGSDVRKGIKRIKLEFE